MLVYTREELTTMYTRDINLVHPPEAWHEHWKEVREKGSFIFESRLKTKDGRVIPVEITANHIVFDNKEYNCAFTRDITERKKAMEMIEISENKYRMLHKNIPQKIFYKDLNSVYVLCNESYAKDLNIEPSEIIGTTDYDFYSKELAEKYRTDDKEIMDSGKKLELEEKYVVNGKEMTVNTLKAPILDELGKIIGIFGVFWDITERKQVEEALRNEKEFTETALDTQQDTFFLFEPATGKAIRWNRAFNNITGYTDEEISRMPAPDSYYDPEDLKRATIFIEKVLETGIGKIELELICKDGRKVPTEYNVAVIKDEAGSPKFFISIGRDITERKQAEEELRKAHDELEKRVQERTADLEKANVELQTEIVNHKKTEANLIENEKRFRAVAISTSDLIWEGDVRDNCLKWYGDIDSILGYDEGEFPRTVSGHMDSIHPEDRDDLIEAVEKAVESGDDFYAEYRIRCKNGDCRYWDGRGSAIGFENGNAVKWIGSVTDITERKISQELHRKNEEKFKKLSHEFNTLLDAIPDRLILLSSELKILWSNRAFDSEMNTQCDQDCEQRCYRICCNLPGPCKNCPVIKSFQTCKEESSEVRDSDGRVFDQRAFPIMDETGQVSSVIEVSRNITARIRMEEEAKLVQTRLIHANKMTSLGTLVSGVAHEINNPNSYIMSNAEMFTEIWKDAARVLKEEGSDKKQLVLGGVPFQELVQLAPALLDGISEGSIRIKNIVQSLINFGKPDKSALDGDIDIEKTIMSSRVILDNHIKKLTDKFHIDCEKNIPPVQGSAKQFEQVLINLIMNALQALPHRDSGIRISASFDKKEENVVVMVKDEGVGMPDTIIQNITDPFFTTRSADGGTGLGLSISYAIIKDHKGELLFESKEGEGTTVTVKLPAKRKLK
jgi:PAS domain S-box-containing protein